MEIGKLKAELENSTKQFVNTITIFPEDFFNIKPLPESWSAAEVAEHVIVVERLLNVVLQGKADSQINRDPKIMVNTIKQEFGDFEKKFTAYGPILPSSAPKSAEELISGFKQNRATLLEIIEKENLSELCHDFKHGIFGNLTRFEWIYFNVYHSLRHIQQIKSINIDELKLK